MSTLAWPRSRAIRSAFIDHGADLHARDEDRSSTPLAYAAMSGQRRMVEFLLRRGAMPTLPDDPPWATPFAWASRSGHHEIAQFLTEYDATGRLPVHTLQEYESLARDLVETFRSGDEQALQRLIDHFGFGKAVAWDRPTLPVRIERVRRLVRERLAQPAGTESADLALSDAQLLIARSEGVESWAELKQLVEESLELWQARQSEQKQMRVPE